MSSTLDILSSLIRTFEDDRVRATNQNDQNTNSLSRRSRRSRLRQRNANQSPIQRLKRETTLLCAKLSGSNKDKLLLSIFNLYDHQITDCNTLSVFLDLIMQRPMSEERYSPIVKRPVILQTPITSSSSQDMFVDIIYKLSVRIHSHIAPHEFRNCVQILCDQYFDKMSETNKLLTSSPLFDTVESDTRLIEKMQNVIKDTSTVEFISRLIAEEILDYQPFGRYLHSLFREGVHQRNIALICGAFRGISKLLRPKLECQRKEDILLKCPYDDDVIVSVERESHLLVYGYFRRHSNANKVPDCLEDICVVLCDVQWYVMQRFQELQQISEDKESYPPRIRLLTKNMLTHYE